MAEILICISGAHTEYASVNPGDLVYADAEIAKALPANFVPASDRVRDFSSDRPPEDVEAAPKKTARKVAAKK